MVDTSVWSLALRRDTESAAPEVRTLQAALTGTDVVVTTGLVLQELLQGFSGPKHAARIAERLGALPYVQPTREDHVAAAELRNTCRRAGIQLGTVDALLARLCIRHGLTLLSTDGDFRHAVSCCELEVWEPKAPRS